MTTSSEPKRVQAPLTGEAAEDAFVGRRQELKAIGSGLEAAACGRGRLEIVSGAPGIGKTRLTHEVAASARARGFYVLRGGCWEGEGAPAYWPWAEVLRSHLSGLSEDVTGAASDFSQLLEIAATRAAVPVRGVVDATKDAQQARFMLFDRFCEFLAATAAAQPLLIIIDDAQSADTGSLLLLQFLAGRLAKLPIAILITSREPLSEMTASTGRHAWARHRVLRGLSRAEARELLAAHAVAAPTRPILDRLMHLTDGNPYFLKELGQLLTEGDVGFDPAGGIALPASLLVVTLQPYHRLSMSCRSLLQAASVVGREFDAELAADAAGLPIREALELLDEAVDRRVVAAVGAARYHFAHALVREAVHDQLHPSDRTRLHEHVALALERRAAVGERISAATLAHHFCMGLPVTQRRQAALYGIAAGDGAHAAFAYEEAVFQFRRAQQISGTSLTDVESCDLLLRLGAAEAGAGEWAGSRRTFEDAAGLARRINCPERLAHAALGFKGMMWATNPVDLDAVSLLEEARSNLPRGSIALEVELLSALSRSLYFSHEVERAKRYSRSAMKFASSLHDPRLQAIALEAHTVGLLQPDRLNDLLDCTTTLIALSDRVRNAELRFNARIFRQCALLGLGHLSDADRELEIASVISEAAPHPRFRWQIALLRVARATLRGNLGVADRLSTVSSHLGSRVHDSSPLQYQLLQDFQRAQLRDYFEDWLRPTEAIIARFPNIPAFRVGQALILTRLSQPDLARELLNELATDEFRLITPNHISLWLLTVLAEVAVATRHTAHARTLYRLLLPYAERFIVAAWGTLLDGSVSHYLALLADLLDQRSNAQKHFRTAIAANRRIGAPALTARSSLHFGIFLKRLGGVSNLATARTLAKRAEGTFRSLDLRILARRAREFLENCTLSPLRQGHALDSKRDLRATTNTFRRDGEYWIVSFRGSTTFLKSSLGLHYIATLLSQPRLPIHVLQLVAGHNVDHAVVHRSDTTAREQYRQRLRDLSMEIDLAESHNDIGARERLIDEQEQLITELSHSFGLSGAPRPDKSSAERARISVRNRIASAIRTIRTYDHACAEFIQRSLKTGVLCVYDPIDPTEWDLG